MTDGHQPQDRARDEIAGGNLPLRTRAQAKYLAGLNNSAENLTQMPVEEVVQLVRELRIQQIELEMQNEELIQSQAALEESRARFRELYDHAPVGYCQVSDPDGLIQDANATLAEMLGHTAAQLNGQRFCAIIEKSHQDVYYYLKRRIQSSLQADSCELQLTRADGSCIWVQLSATIDSSSSGLRISAVNIDPRIRAEAAKNLLENQLRESQKMEAVGTLASGIAHDFNNILTVIVINAEVATRLMNDTASAAASSLKEIQRAAARARELVRQILAFCRRQPTGLHTISLTEVIEESISLLRSTMPTRFDLQFTCDTSVPLVSADSTQIEQVIINLATNAIQAMDGRPGRLAIHLDSLVLDAQSIQALGLHSPNLRTGDQVVRITFSDDGPGMAPEVVGRIFEPFFTTRSANEGTGLGLAVVHGIVRTHHGEISVKTKLGQGTTFTIYLPSAQPTDSTDTTSLLVDSPVIDSPALERGQVRDHTRAAELSECRVLYVDDDQSVLKSVVQLLSANGVKVSGYSDANDVLELLREPSDNFKVLVTDYNMPGLSGLDFARLVRKVRPALPVVIISGFIDEELTSQAHDAGVTALMEKPFSTRGFLGLLAEITDPAQAVDSPVVLRTAN